MNRRKVAATEPAPRLQYALNRQVTTPKEVDAIDKAGIEQLQIRSTELTTSVSRSAAMIACQCARSCTSMSR